MSQGLVDGLTVLAGLDYSGITDLRLYLGLLERRPTPAHEITEKKDQEQQRERHR